MSKFDTYFLMNEQEVVEYVKEKVNFFTSESVLTCKEIGDGNLNYVFRVVDKNSSKSIIVKQAGNTARISDDFKLSTNRIRIESDILKMQGELAPGLVPEVYLFDETMSCCVMEDLSDHTILRTALLEHKTFPTLADDISTYMVNTLLLTTDVVLDHKKKKSLVEKFINPELCEISEDLVFTEPYNDINNRNELFPLTSEWIKNEIYGDKKLHLEVAKLKFEFMTNTQSLIHGDLHTGSLFVKENSTKVIDPEFAFYGPIGYDVGNVVANLIFAWANGEANNKEEFIAWIEQTIVETIDLFKEKLLISWEKNVHDVMAQVSGFNTWYLENILKDTSAVAGLELTRRIVGLAKVKDITSIEDEELRARAEKICLTVAKKYILERDIFKDGNSFIKALKEVQMQVN